MIQFPCSACGYELKAADGTSAAALLVCDRCGEQVRIPAAQNAVPVATVGDDFRNLDSSATDDGEIPPPPADDDVPPGKFDLPDPLPPELKALGDPVRSCPTASKTPWVLIGGGVLAFLLAVLMVVLWIGKTNAPGGRVHSPIGMLMGIMGLLPLGAFLIYLGAALDWQARVIVFRKGFAHIKRGTITIFPYDDIDGVWQAVTKHYYNGVYTGTTYNYRIRAKAAEISLDNVYPAVQWLGERIQNEVNGRQLHCSINTLNEGGTVRFGRLSVGPEGIGCDGTVLPWSEVEKVEIQQGIISVRKHGKWFNWGKVTVAEVPNVFVFIALVDNIIGVNTKRR